MIKTTLIFVLFTCGCIANSTAQNDKERAIIKRARLDVNGLRLTALELKPFRQSYRSSTSDLFKPKKENVSDTTLLSDSVYVKAYRNFAFIKTRSRVNTGLYTTIGVGGVLALGAIVLSN